MSPDAHRKMKALLLIGMLAVSEARHVQQNIRVGASPSWRTETRTRAPFKPSKSLLARGFRSTFGFAWPRVHSHTTVPHEVRNIVPLSSIGKLSPASALSKPRAVINTHAFGAKAAVPVVAKVVGLPSTPAALFNYCFLALAVTAALLKAMALKFASSDTTASKAETPANVKALQLRYLPVFWMLRMADWLQGPYFYEVYSSKIFGGQKASLDLVSKLFLTGFGTTALLGPMVGRLIDQYGRKLGTLAFSVFYVAGALSTKSALLWVLLLGRLASGIGTSLLFSAPEAWLVGDAQRVGAAASLGGIFGAAYTGDALVAITAGQVAQKAAGMRGPTGPFEVSTLFLAAGAALAALIWKENKAGSSSSESNAESGPSIKEAAEMVLADKKIMAVGAVQALFEGAMYIFVLQWPPAVISAVTKIYGSGAATPFGVVFSCFMLSCLLGSTIFGVVAKKVSVETSTVGMLGIATAAMAAGAGAALAPTTPLTPLVAAFFLFEMCVGMYFPSISTLRSKYLPDSHRSVIMNLFGIPLNALVVSVFLSIKKLGVGGALSVATGALSIAMASMSVLLRLSMAIGSGDNKKEKGTDADAEDSE